MKKPILSSFSKIILFAFIFVGIIVTLFTVYTLNNPDALNFISNIKPDSVIFIGFMIIVGFIGLSIVLGILCYLLFDILGSTMFFLILHICLLLICSPYFLIVLIWGTYKFLTSSSSSSSTSSSSINVEDIILSEKKSYLGNFNLFGSKKTEEEKKRIAAEKAEKKIGKRNSWFSSKSVSNSNKNSNFDSILKGGDGDETSSLQKFINILSEIDDTKLLSLWKKLLFIYDIQTWLLESSLSKIYNKLMHRS